MSHQYRITVEALSETAASTAAEAPQVLSFEVENHDDIFKVIKKIESRGDFKEVDAVAFGVGLKLFGEVMLKNRSLPLFSGFAPHFMDFMKELKKGIPGK
ncbi:DUF3861 domain-containing protein [Desulfovibrio sp. OttesenSCG-928-G15]|nr:DUF3861 domain-containing protein [Desulfovibrio sp. OttesenSCG-928-G15]